jgi:hypothetical protein
MKGDFPMLDLGQFSLSWPAIWGCAPKIGQETMRMTLLFQAYSRINNAF